MTPCQWWEFKAEGRAIHCAYWGYPRGLLDYKIPTLCFVSLNFHKLLLTSINYVWIETSPLTIGRSRERKGNVNIKDLKHLKDPELFFLKYRNYPSSANHVPHPATPTPHNCHQASDPTSSLNHWSLLRHLTNQNYKYTILRALGGVLKVRVQSLFPIPLYFQKSWKSLDMSHSNRHINSLS